MNRFTLLRFVGMRPIGLCALAVALVVPSLANASFVATLSVRNDPLLTGQNFGTVTVDDSVTNQVTITFLYNSSLNGGFDRFQKIGFNVDPSITLVSADISAPANWDVEIDTDKISGLNGYGKFDVGVSTSGDADRLNTVVVVINQIGITADAFRSLSDGNDPGEPAAMFAAHYIPGAGSKTYMVAAVDIRPTPGPLDETNHAPAPPSAVLALLGIAFASGFHFIRRKRLAAAC